MASVNALGPDLIQTLVASEVAPALERPGKALNVNLTQSARPSLHTHRLSGRLEDAMNGSSRTFVPAADGTVVVQLLFSNTPGAEAYEQHPAPEGKDETAFIHPSTLFDELTASSSNDIVGTDAYVAIGLPRRWSFSQDSSALTSLIVPVKKGSTSILANGRDDVHHPCIVLPSNLRHFFGAENALDSEVQVPIRTHLPLNLSHLVLSAMGEASFTFAQNNQAQVEGGIHGRLVRQGDVVVIREHTFVVVMTEPVLQGIASSSETEIIITLDVNLGHTLANGRTNGMKDEFEASNIIVDEHFFTKGALESLEGNIDDDTIARSLFADTSGVHFHPSTVQDVAIIREAIQSWSQRSFRDASGFDLCNCVLLDEATFPLLGAFEGDWALAEIEGQGKARAVKMLCTPRGYLDGRRIAPDTLARVFLSPFLLQNFYSEESFDPASLSSPITLRSLGSWRLSSSQQDRSDAIADCPLPLPFADSLSIARIASPLSTNRKYQSLFLDALRSHFESARRIVQKGDVFAVSFDKSKVQWAIEQTNEDAAAQSAQASTDEELYSVVLPADGDTDGNITTGVVYFCVTDVSPELSETAAVDNIEASQTDLWIHEMARAGQFGSAVDPALTKMVQTGIVRTRVIDASQWLQAASDTPPLPLGLSPLTSATSVYGRLLRLTQAVLMPDASQYDLHLTVLLKGARGCGKRTVARWIAQKTGVHLLELNCYDLVGDTDARTEGVLRARIEQTVGCAPAILLLRHVEALARKSQALETGQEPTMATVLQNCLRDLRVPTSSLPIVVLGTTGDAERCPTGVLACFRHELHFEAPNEAERAAILEACLAGSALSVDVNLKSIATQTAALVASDLVDLVGRAQLASIERVLKQDLGSGRRSTDQLDTAVSEAGVALCGSDFDTALAKARLSYSESIGAPKIPNVTWDDVGGLISVKDDIMDTIQLPLEHPELFVDGLKKRSGILLYGPPGTGKTLLAKAVATSCSLNFFSVKGPELLNMYIGESEANVRRVFQRARDAKPCVIFFDELDSIAPKRGNQGDSGGVMDRIVSQLLAELDGMSSGDGASDVFVIGATNRPDLLDPALLRPGRFDRMLYLAVSQTHSEQLNILQALTRKFKLDEDVGDLQVIAEQCPMNLTGADFYALCSDAMLKSMTRKAEWIDKQVTALNARAEATRAAGGQVAHPMPLTPQYYLDEMAAAADLDVKVAKADFEAALSELVPSVSAQEMAHYRTVQQRFSNTDTDTADTANDQEDAANARHSVKSDDRGGQLHSPMELDHGTVGQIIDAMQNAKTQNGHGKGGALMNGDRDPTNGDPDDRTQEQRRESKGKGRARE